MVRYTDEVVHPDPIPQLGFPAGSKERDIINALVEKIAHLEGLLNKEFYPVAQPTNTDNIKFIGQMGTSIGLGVEAAKIKGAALNLKTEKGDQTISLQYEAAKFDLPEGAQIISTTVNITGQTDQGGRTQILNGKQKSQKLDIAYNRFPINIDSRVVIATKTGDVELKKTMIISSDEAIEKAEEYEVIDRSVQLNAEVSLTEKILQMDNRLGIIEKKK